MRVATGFFTSSTKAGDPDSFKQVRGAQQFAKSSNIKQLQSDSDPQLYFNGQLVLTSTPKKPKQHIEDISGWLEPNYALSKSLEGSSVVSYADHVLVHSGCFSVSAQHVLGVTNQTADALSRFHWQEFWQPVPDDQPHPTPIP